MQPPNLSPDLFRFHHLGLLTSDEGRAAPLLSALGYELDDAVEDPRQGAVLRMARGRNGNPDVEIIVPALDNTRLRRLLKRRDDYMYHLCFVTASLAAAAEALIAGDQTVMEASPPTPAVMFGGKRVAFYVVSGIGLIELLEA